MNTLYFKAVPFFKIVSIIDHKDCTKTAFPFQKKLIFKPIRVNYIRKIKIYITNEIHSNLIFAVLI
jgi:hypothetical protein